MPVLSAQGLVKHFGPQVVLDGATFTVTTGERVGLVGVNGSGKSTIARILAGVETADAGTVARRRGASIAYLDQNPTFDGDPTAREAVFAGLAKWAEAKARHDSATFGLESGEGDVDALLTAQETAAADVERLGGWDRLPEVDAVLSHLGVRLPDARVASMSGGERRRVALARLLVGRPDLAILDEPTNHLDVDTVDWLEGHLADDFQGAILLVTHDRYLLDRVCTRTLELDRGTLRSYDGGYGLYLEQKTERLLLEARTESNRQNFLRKEIEWLRRQPKARSTKQKARIERAETAKAVVAPREERVARLSVEEARAGKTILELRHLGIDLAGRTLIADLEMFLVEGERIGVVGANGTGKTTLLRAIMGQLPQTRGEIVLGKNTKIAYFDQDRSGLDDAKSIFDNVAGDQPKIEVDGEAIEPRSYLERFLFDPHKQRQQVGSLSGGERARVALAKMLRQKANLLLFDEPTNDLDVSMLGALETMLADFSGTAVVVTHDRWFLDRVATSILAFEEGGKVTRYPGNYDAYRTAKQGEKADETARRALESTRPKARAASTPPPRAALTSAEKRELAGILEEIDAAEARVRLSESALSDPAAYARGGDEVRRRTEALAAAKADVLAKVARWEELEAKKGG